MTIKIEKTNEMVVTDAKLVRKHATDAKAQPVKPAPKPSSSSR